MDLHALLDHYDDLSVRLLSSRRLPLGHTIEWVHQRITCYCCASSTCCCHLFLVCRLRAVPAQFHTRCQWMMPVSVSAHCLLDCFICRKVYRMRRSCPPHQILFHTALPPTIPAPTITLDIPRHNAPTPSTLDIVAIALDTPVYLSLIHI